MSMLMVDPSLMADGLCLILILIAILLTTATTPENLATSPLLLPPESSKRSRNVVVVKRCPRMDFHDNMAMDIVGSIGNPVLGFQQTGLSIVITG